jgi:hypothetical protein
VTDPTAVQVLRRAKALLVANGWLQRGHYDARQHRAGMPVANCRLCIRGAVNVAAGSADPVLGCDASHAAHAAVSRTLLAAGFKGGTIRFNDAPGRTLADVFALLDRAIELAGTVSA